MPGPLLRSRRSRLPCSARVALSLPPSAPPHLRPAPHRAHRGCNSIVSGDASGMILMGMWQGGSRGASLDELLLLATDLFSGGVSVRYTSVTLTTVSRGPFTGSFQGAVSVGSNRVFRVVFQGVFHVLPLRNKVLEPWLSTWAHSHPNPRNIPPHPRGRPPALRSPAVASHPLPPHRRSSARRPPTTHGPESRGRPPAFITHLSYEWASASLATIIACLPR